MDAYDGGSGAPQGRSGPGRRSRRGPGSPCPARDPDPRALRRDRPPRPVAPRAGAPRPVADAAEAGERAAAVAARASGPDAAEAGNPEPGEREAVAPEAASPESDAPGAGRPEAVASEAHEPQVGVPGADSPEAGSPEAGALAPRTGVAALSPRYQVCAALALAVVAVVVCLHVGMVFLHVAPSNTVTKAHGKAIDDWIYPEFEQNWKLFAPNPLQQNISVQVRAQVRTADGGSRTTGWYDLSAQDGRAIDGNLVPSHTQQNELRRAWDFFTATHDNDNRSVGRPRRSRRDVSAPHRGAAAGARRRGRRRRRRAGPGPLPDHQRDPAEVEHREGVDEPRVPRTVLVVGAGRRRPRGGTR